MLYFNYLLPVIYRQTVFNYESKKKYLSTVSLRIISCLNAKKRIWQREGVKAVRGGGGGVITMCKLNKSILLYLDAICLAFTFKIDGIVYIYSYKNV